MSEIDVSKCKDICQCETFNHCICQSKLTTNSNCDANTNCYYKQLQQLKQENEKLKEENYQLQKNCQICENFIDGIPCKPLRDMDYDLQNVIKQRDNTEQKLEKIKEICSDEVNQEFDVTGKLKDILEIINKEK